MASFKPVKSPPFNPFRAFIRPAKPVPAASLSIFGIPLADNASAVATPVTNPVAILCCFNAFRTDFRIALLVFLGIFFMTERKRIARRHRLLCWENGAGSAERISSALTSGSR